MSADLDIIIPTCDRATALAMKLMARYGGCGLLPSGVYHQELPTTIPHRRVRAEDVFDPGRILPETGALMPADFGGVAP